MPQNTPSSSIHKALHTSAKDAFVTMVPTTLRVKVTVNRIISVIFYHRIFLFLSFPCQGRKPGSSACYASALPLSWTIRLNVFFWSLNWTSPFPQRLFICLLFSSHMMLNPLKLNFGVLNLAPWCETQYLHQHTCETHWCSSIQADQVN